MRKHFAILAATASALASTPAFAHITLETGEAAVGSAYRAVLRVPHGCAGAATTKIRVQIPEGLISVKPMPHAGWELDTVTGAYAATYTLYGSAVPEGVKEINWSGNLPDEYYDEFVFRGTLADSLAAGQTLYFPIVQECGTVIDRWIEIPEAGKSEDDYEHPAPGLRLLPPN